MGIEELFEAVRGSRKEEAHGLELIAVQLSELQNLREAMRESPTADDLIGDGDAFADLQSSKDGVNIARVSVPAHLAKEFVELRDNAYKHREIMLIDQLTAQGIPASVLQVQ